MKKNMKHRLAGRVVRAVSLVGLAWLPTFSILGFPPVPAHTVYGIVRDQYGVPLIDSTAQVFFQTAFGTNLVAMVQPGLAPGVNFQISVPIDSGQTSDIYVPTAMLPAAPFRLLVKMGGKSYVPMEMSGNFAQLGEPAQSTRIDLTLGVDSDLDGLPDAWELSMISSGHLNLSLKDFRPDLRIGGNSLTVMDAYLAGTYPWNPTDGFRLDIIGMQETLPIVEFMALRGHTYTIRSSDNLVEWTSVRFQAPLPVVSAPQLLFETNKMSRIRVVISDVGAKGIHRFYRLQVD